MKQIEYEHSSNEPDEDELGYPNEPLEGFSKLDDGLQSDGVVISYLGWASIAIGERFGIEEYVGISGFNDASNFLEWVRNKIDLKLEDWEAISIPLHRCWYSTDDLYTDYFHKDPDEKSFCYMAWREDNCSDAVKTYPTTVYALRHVDFRLKNEICLSAFRISRQLSLSRDIWTSLNGDAEFKPSSMKEYLHYGYHLSGKAPGAEKDTELTWPSYDLPSVLDDLERFKADGYSELHIWSCGIGFEYKRLTPAIKANLVKAYQHYGAGMPAFNMVGSGVC